MTLILIVLGMIALFFVIQRKSWFMAFGVILLFSSVAIITSIIQIQIITALGLLAVIGVMWGTRATRRSVSRTQSRLSSLFGSKAELGSEKEQAESEAVENTSDTELDFTDREKGRQKQSLVYFVLLLTLISLFTPIALYAREFGVEGWQQYQSWMAMGNELAGVYAIIIALLVFLFLVTMLVLRFQNRASDNDQTFIQDSRKDIEFYLTELDHCLSQWADETSTVRQQLHKRCSTLNEKKLANNRVQEKLTEFADSNEKLLNIWHPLVELLDALGTPNRFPYKHNHQRCIQKSVSILSQQTCEALDKLAFAVPSEGRSSRYFWEQVTTN